MKYTRQWDGPNHELTTRELEVLCLLSLQNKEIASRLNLRFRTVEKMIENLLPKLNAFTRSQALIVALKKELVTLEDIIS